MAKRLGLSLSYVGQLEGGKRTPSDSILALVNMVELQLDNGLITEDDGTPFAEDVEALPSGLKMIPLISYAHAGKAGLYEEIPKHWQHRLPSDCKDPKAFALTLEGESMAKDYQPGDVLTVMPSHEAYNGCPAVVRFNNDGVLFRIVEYFPEMIRLIALNPAYPPTEHRKDEFAWIYPIYKSERLLWKR